MNSSPPTVSVIVPNYNHARFLRERLDSILNQNFQDFELILLDDCSTDESLKILQEYASDPRVSHFVVNETNSGSPFAQWKKGIDLSVGRYVWIAESDDVAEPTFLANMNEGINAGATLCFSASKIIDQHGVQTAVYSLPEVSQPTCFDGMKFVENFMQTGNGIPNASAVIFQRNAIRRISLPSHMRFCGDWVIWLRLVSAGMVFYQNKPLNSFRFHDKTTRPKSSESSTKPRTFVETIDSPEYMNEFLIATTEGYKTLGRRWSPATLEPVLRQIKLIQQSQDNYQTLASSIPFRMKIRFAIFQFRRTLGPRAWIRKILNLAVSNSPN